MGIYLLFADSISESYSEKLQTFTNNIYAQGITKNRPPGIKFPGRNEETYREFLELQRAYSDRYRA